MGERGRVAERTGRRPERQGALAIDRLAERIDHAPEPAGRWTNRAGDRGNYRPAPTPHALERRERHEQSVAAGKAYDFAWDGLAGSLDDHPRADRHRVQWPGDFNH
jgi:hypothetical protein